MNAFADLDQELDAEMLAGPVIPYNWIHVRITPYHKVST